MSSGVECRRGPCGWSGWRGVYEIPDMLVRKCSKCGEVQVRILPPDVRKGPSLADLDAVWGPGGRREGAE